MAPAAEPKAWQVLDRVRATLAGIVAGSAYWYTPHLVRVVRGGNAEWEASALDESLGAGPSDPATVYLIRRGAGQLERQQTGDAVNGPRDRATLNVQVLVAQRFVASAPTDTPTEAQVIERMLADVVRALTFVDPGVGSVDADDVLMGESAIVEEMPTNWAIGALSFSVSYDYFSSAP